MLTIVAPCHNEAEGLVEFHRRLSEVVNKLDMDVEIILIDDGSTDSTWSVIQHLSQQDPSVRGIRFSRNFGHQAALKSGFEAARGVAVICMDADLQHPPDVIPQMIAVWRQGYTVVNTVRRYNRADAFFKRVSSEIFYRIFAFISGMPIRPGIADFRLVDRQVLRTLRAMPERNSSVRFAIQWMGFRQAYLDYDSGRRFAGSTKYNFSKMFLFGMRSIVQFSVFPLRLSFMLSGLAACMFCVYGIYALYEKLIAGTAVPGWTSIILTLSFIASMQFLAIGLLGEYVAVIYDEVKGRPSYIVADTIAEPAPEGRKRGDDG